MTKNPITYLKRLLLVSVPGLVAALLFMEAALRISGYTPYYLDARTFEPSQVADMVFNLRPGFRGLYAGQLVSVNKLGFRSSETAEDIARSAVRIVVIGDSVAFGQGVKDGETLPDQLAARLRKRLPGPIAVVNLGVPMYDTCHEFAMFRERAVPLNPQVALLIYLDNDTDPLPLHIKDGAIVTPDTRTGLVGGFMTMLRKSSAAYNFVWTYWQVAKFHRVTIDQYREMIAAKFNENNPGWRRSRGCLNDMVGLAKLRSIRLIVIPFPELGAIHQEPYPFRSYVKTVCDAARAQGAECVDVVPTLKDANIRLRVNRIDLHPSAEVYARTADFLEKMLP
jgi:hypothetical protein